MATWWTLKHRETFTKTHTNHIVYDSALEAAEANKLEKNPNVTAFAKNDHLGFAIQCTFSGIVRHYYPDFLVKLDNDKTLILETRGLKTIELEVKKAALEEWVTTVNYFKEYGQWCSGISYSHADVDGIINKHL